MAKKFNWRAFFSDFRGQRMNPGDGEEQRYQAFKARFIEEESIRWERELPETPSPYDLNAVPSTRSVK